MLHHHKNLVWTQIKELWENFCIKLPMNIYLVALQYKSVLDAKRDISCFSNTSTTALTTCK